MMINDILGKMDRLFRRKLVSVDLFNTLIDYVKDNADKDKDGYVSFWEIVLLFFKIWRQEK